MSERPTERCSPCQNSTSPVDRCDEGLCRRGWDRIRGQNYGDGLMVIKDASHGQGQSLFFSVRIVDGEEILTLLLVNKKESQEAPARVLATARRRMRETG